MKARTLLLDVWRVRESRICVCVCVCIWEIIVVKKDIEN